MTKNEELIGVWDKIAKQDFFVMSTDLFSSPVYSWLLSCVNKKILEIGVGSGRYSIPLEKNNKMFGIDISFEMLKNARHFSKNLNLSCQDCRNLAFKDNIFDVVFSVGVVEHFPETALALREHLRVCKREGTVIIEVPHKRSLHYLLKRLAQSFNLYTMGYEDSYTLEEFVNMLKKTNFKFIIEEVIFKDIDVNSATTFFRKICSLLVFYTDKFLKILRIGGDHMMVIKLKTL